MKTIQVTPEGALVLLAEGELAILANALNETLAAVEGWEFSTRVGVEPREADALRRKIVELSSDLGRAAASETPNDDGVQNT